MVVVVVVLDINVLTHNSAVQYYKLTSHFVIHLESIASYLRRTANDTTFTACPAARVKRYYRKPRQSFKQSVDRK